MCGLKCLRFATGAGAATVFGFGGIVVDGVTDFCCAAGFVAITSLIFKYFNAVSMRGFTSAPTIISPL